MEEQDEKPPGPLKASAQDLLLPQEIIIKVEEEDTGSLVIPSQEDVNFRIVTVDFTQDEQETLNPAQMTVDSDVILENHRDLVSWDTQYFWSLPISFSDEPRTWSKGTI
ncbi:zinc finger protein 180 isoform X3 [Dasypus novemcinctus]|uniref:zinc finger protein 180 isoform X3 n=1 Tax=Dasypus novemcinctus TaxID=9361 RepID=UPI00062AB747|nr:zinc finger protein 180 isoform X2 [Dasypus novemcinctus]